MKKIVNSLLLAIIYLAVSATGSWALLLDFTDSGRWSGLDGQESFSNRIDGLGVTVSANIGTMTFNGNGPSAGIPLTDGAALAGEGDGIGIRYLRENDEINSRGKVAERLTVTFDRSVVVNFLYVLDLFTREIAQFTINEIEREFKAPGSTPWGFHEISLDGGIATTAIRFSVPKQGPGDDGDSDFALAGIRISQIPLPSSVLFLAAGLVGLVGLRRRLSR